MPNLPESKEWIQKLHDHCARENVIIIEPRRSEQGNLWCIPLSLGEEFLLVSSLKEFDADGFRVIPISQIAAVEHGKGERFYKSVVVAEDVQWKLGDPGSIDLDTARGLFDSLAKRGVPLCIEGRDDGGFIFEVGMNLDVREELVKLSCLDGDGTWCDEPSDILYKSIVEVTFEDRYSQLLLKHSVFEEMEEDG